MALLGAFVRCDFVSFPAHFYAISRSGRFEKEEISLNFGIFYYQTWSVSATVDGIEMHEYCHEYPKSMTIDGAWKACRFAAFAAAILGPLFLVVNLLWMRQNVLLGWEGGEYALVAILQGLTLLFLSGSACKNNDIVQGLAPILDIQDNCSLSTGGILVISAIALWSLASAANVAVRIIDKREKGIEEEREALIGVGS